MGPVNLVLWIAGIAFIALGYTRARAPWSRYQALRDQDSNEQRYAAWRGGVRDTSTTGASVAMEILRRQWQVGAAIAVVGIVLVIAGFVVK